MKIESKKIKKINNIYHGFFSRNGGVSKGIYSSLNLGFGSKDRRVDLQKNVTIIKKKSKANILNLVNQEHGNKIINLQKKNNKLKIGNADGIFTSLSNNAIGILTADCAPIIFSSKCSNFICIVHGGWKGLYKNIIKKAVNLFKKNNIKSDNIICAVGPCISQKSYEVQLSFKKKIIKNNPKFKKLFKLKNKKIYFDLKKYALEKLLNEKIKKQNIEISNLDTYSNSKLFYSYRRSVHKQEDDYGRNISIIVKRNH